MMTSTHPKRIGSWSHLKNPELIVPEAFEEHPQRIQRQIAAATDTPLCAVVAAFEELCPESSSSTGEGEKPMLRLPCAITQLPSIAPSTSTMDSAFSMQLNERITIRRPWLSTFGMTPSTFTAGLQIRLQRRRQKGLEQRECQRTRY